MNRLHKSVNARLMKDLNRHLVARVIWASRDGIARSEIAQVTRLNPSTVTDIVRELTEEGLVTEVVMGSKHTAVGRKPVMLRLSDGYGSAVGVQIGDNQVAAVLIDLKAKVLATRRVALVGDCSPERCVALAVSAVSEVVAAAGTGRRRIIGVGVGVAGLVDPASGVVASAPNLGWHEIPLQRILEERLEWPLWVENEVKAMAVGEKLFGSGTSARNLFCCSVGLGVGGAAVIEGRLFRGTGGIAGELGHSTVDPDGAKCGCGKVGCLETVAGGRAVMDRALAAVGANPAGRLALLLAGRRDSSILDAVGTASSEGDPDAKAIVEEVGKGLALGLSQAVLFYGPEVVVLGGDLLRRIPALYLAVSRHIGSFIPAMIRHAPRILPPALGDLAEAVGAASIIVERFFNPYDLPPEENWTEVVRRD